MTRELAEETGLLITELSGPAFLVNASSVGHRSVLAVAFEVSVTGEPALRDAEVSEVAWVDVSEAVTRLSEIDTPDQREPIIAYLCGEAPPGTLWVYREQERVMMSLPGQVPRR